MAEQLSQFVDSHRSEWESKSRIAKGVNLSVAVAAERKGPVKMHVAAENFSAGLTLTPASARLLAAELIAAAAAAEAA